jgi:hypothetical protein
MVRLIALLLTVLTGFTGLVYEVAWQRYLATLLGSHGEATSAVLGIFLGGLAVGYAVFGRASRWLVERARHRSRPLRLLSFYALVEAGIGAYALLFPLLFSAAQYLSLLSPIDHDALGFAFDVALSALLIGPPAVLMGVRFRSSRWPSRATSNTRPASTPGSTAQTRSGPLRALWPGVSSWSPCWAWET